jgi:hypothetical protein
MKTIGTFLGIIASAAVLLMAGYLFGNETSDMRSNVGDLANDIRDVQSELERVETDADRRLTEMRTATRNALINALGEDG